MSSELFPAWWSVVKETLDNDVKDVDGWGLAGRYEASNRQQHKTHEQLIGDALIADGFIPGKLRYPSEMFSGTKRADGVVEKPSVAPTTLWYELKSVYVPHYASPGDYHNDDYARLLRLGHPNGALGDLDRLRQLQNVERVFLLLALTWTQSKKDVALLEQYGIHRDRLVESFQILAGLGLPNEHTRITGLTQSWTGWAMAWVL